jgi:hypothetical protein
MGNHRRATTRRSNGRRWPVLAFAIALAVASLAMVGSAGASHLEITVTVDDPAQLVTGVYLEVPVSVTCPTDIAAEPYTWVYDELVGLSVTQKAGREIARGGGGFQFYDDSIFGGESNGTPLTCDGTPHTYVVNVFPSPGSPAFHGGKAVVQVSGYIALIDPNSFFQDWTEFATGPLTMSIRG